MLENERRKKLMHVVSRCIQETDFENDSKKINQSYECAEEPRYKNTDEVINHFYECKQNNDFVNFNLPEACEWLRNEIDDKLIAYGHCDKELFIEQSLERNFPGCTTLYAGHYQEPEYGMYLAIQNAIKEGNPYAFFRDPLVACEELETIRFRKLQKEYEKDPDILNLKNICDNMLGIFLEEDNEYSPEEKIEIISSALHAKHPKGLVFDLNTLRE